MLVNDRLSQQSSKEECKPWRLGATARYYAPHKKDPVTNEEVGAKIQQAIGPHEDQTIVVWSCFPFIRSGQNHLARHS